MEEKISQIVDRNQQFSLIHQLDLYLFYNPIRLGKRRNLLLNSILPDNGIVRQNCGYGQVNCGTDDSFFKYPAGNTANFQQRYEPTTLDLIGLSGESVKPNGRPFDGWVGADSPDSMLSGDISRPRSLLNIDHQVNGVSANTNNKRVAFTTRWVSSSEYLFHHSSMR